jgi:hypothetical protein
MSFECFKRGERCPRCQQIKNNLSKRILEKIFKILKENNLEFIEFPNDYINRDSLITYKCSVGHITTRKISTFLKSKNCPECTKLWVIENQKGSKGSNWQGGKTYLSKNIKPLMKEWKKESMKNCNYKCVITGKRFDDIHHLYSFHLILEEAINELKLKYKSTIGEYSNEELIAITNKVKEIHKKYPLGVCLTKEIHDLFHKLYGIRNNTPEQFYEFKQKIESGEIQINKVA